MPRDEKIHTLTITFNPSLVVGQALEIEGEPVIVVGIAHHQTGTLLSTSELKVIEPNWFWKLRYKTRRLLRRLWWIVAAPLRWLRKRA